MKKNIQLFWNVARMKTLRNVALFLIRRREVRDRDAFGDVSSS